MEIQTIDEKTDVLFLKMPPRGPVLSLDAADRLRGSLRSQLGLPNLRIIVLEDGIDVSILRPVVEFPDTPEPQNRAADPMDSFKVLG